MDLDTDDFDLQAFEASEPDFMLESKYGVQTSERAPGAAIIRTSDRITFRRCRRKWNWYYSGRHNLRPQNESAPFWLGSGIHFSMEDFHGYNKYGHPAEALAAYEQATRKSGLIMPDDTNELLDLGQGMLNYYESWLANRDPLQTLWVDGEPQVEVNVLIEIPKEDLLQAGCPQRILDLYTAIYYSMTFDRTVIDDYRRLWLIEYKSAKNFAWHHFETDQQVSSYMWGMGIKYPEYPIAGTCYQQHKKQVPEPPAFLSQTKRFSTSKRMKTTYAMYSTALANLYGRSPSNWPEPNRLYLEWVLSQETETADSLIKRDYVERNEHQIRNEYSKMLLEISEMLDPDIRLYPNPTRDCRWDCPFNLPCIHLDSGADWVSELQRSTIDRSSDETNWRQYL
jgi:PD-(D/E)XK nuclease superfamily